MNKKISTIIGILIIVFVAGVAGASILFFSQGTEEDLSLGEDDSIFQKELEVNTSEEIFDNMTFSYSEKGTTNGFYKNKEYGFQLDYQEPLEINDSDGFIFDASVLVGDSTRLTKKNFIITKTEGGYDHPIEYYCEQGAPNTFMTSFNDIDFCQHTMYEEVNGDIVFNYLAYHIIIDREWITFNFNYTSCNPSYSEECRDLSYVSDEKLEEEARKIISTFKFLD